MNLILHTKKKKQLTKQRNGGIKMRNRKKTEPIETQGLYHGCIQVSQKPFIGNRKSWQNNNANGFVLGEAGSGKARMILRKEEKC